MTEGKKIIDFHTHVFPQKIAEKAVKSLSRASHTVPFSDGTDAGLLEVMKQAGVSLSVILPVATSPQQVKTINDAAVLTNRSHDRLLSFGGIHPLYDHYEDELLRIRDMGIRGIKIHPVYQDMNIDDPRFIRLLRKAADLDFIVVTHAGDDIGYPGAVMCSPLQCRRVVEEIGKFRFVLAHMGGWKNWDRVPELLADTGVYIDTAFSTGRYYPVNDGYWHEEDCRMLDSEGFMRIVEAFGTDRVLFGSDSPWSDLRESAAFIENLPLSEEEKDRIFYRNADKLLSQ